MAKFKREVRTSARCVEEKSYRSVHQFDNNSRNRHHSMRIENRLPILLGSLANESGSLLSSPVVMNGNGFCLAQEMPLATAIAGHDTKIDIIRGVISSKWNTYAISTYINWD